MSIITGGEGGSLSSGNNNNIISSGKEERVVVVGAGKQEVVVENFHASNNSLSSTTTLSNGSSTQQFALDQSPPANKKKRNPPGNPDPSAEVIALSPNTLLARNRFVCEICNKGFQRDQNLQLHRRGHNLPWKLKQRNSNEIIRKRVYICPELSCVHHNPARALGDLTGIKKHFCRKHGEKKWKCEKCSKKYAVQSDYKAHSKTCGTREYKCECGTIFSRRDSFITHRAFCDAIAEENNKTTQLQQLGPASSNMGRHPNHLQTQQISSRELISSLINSIPPAPTATILNDSDNKYHHVAANPPATETPQVLIKQNNTNNNTIIPNHLIIKNPLDHHHQQQQVSLNNNNNMFSSSTTSLSLDHQHQEYQNGYMSATALLQKAAQMGSTVSTASSTMAPSSFGLDYNVNNGNGTGLGVFSGLIFDHGHNVHHGNNDITFMDSTIGSRNDVVLHGEKSCDNMGLASSTTGGDVMTVDFLGIGRSTRPAGNLNNNNFHEQKVQVLNLHHHQQQNNKQLFNGGSIEHQGLQGLSQFGMGKHVWEV